GARGEMHYGIDCMFVQYFAYELAVADIADHELRADHGFAKTGAEFIENHDALASLDQLQHHVAADVARATGDQNGFSRRHGVFPMRAGVEHEVACIVVVSGCTPLSGTISSGSCAGSAPVCLNRLRNPRKARSTKRYESNATANAKARFCGKAVTHASEWRSRNGCCQR